MANKKLFSQHYSTDTNKHEDKEKFRNRILKYLEDVVHSGWKHDTYQDCRHRMGIDITYQLTREGLDKRHFQIEETFSERPIADILDFMTVVYESWVPHVGHVKKKEQDTVRLDRYIKNINEIFEEESMMYTIDNNGHVRYYPDEEFRQLTKSTLICLNNPKYSDYLNRFNDVLDDLYRHRCSESPIHGLFSCLETFILTILNNKKIKQLNKSSLESLIEIITNKVKQDETYREDEKEILQKISDTLNITFLSWTKSSHKYRHGKKDQINTHVPPELFHYIFSVGISIFRLLLEMDDKYSIMPKTPSVESG